MVEAQAGIEYNIDQAIVEWMEEPRTQRRMNTICGSVGGWVDWAEFELECEFRAKFNLPTTVDIREQSVFEGREKAHLVLPRTAEFDGVIIELKCENKLGQRGDAMQTPVGEDIEKRYKVKAAYQDYRFVALAMAYTPEAEEALARVGMRPIPKAVAVLKSGGVMKAYKETMTLGSLSKDMDDLTEALHSLSMSRPSSPTGHTGYAT